VSSHWLTELRNDATMIAMATISEKLATMAARLTIACPGAPRSCAQASAVDARPLSGKASNAFCDSRGISRIPPTSRQAMAA
jgi:hypothetical protein